ncbi:hypothetical protein JCGZ_20161 [Jatropha curcas]|uniref:Uncharacterized protein n=1 Tax=Jatropha curcas TaxID=180498 RepID=A0A067LK57_JATCU|nr:hypothetical protein JCGZ_20161 [Jatropha curcas]
MVEARWQGWRQLETRRKEEKERRIERRQWRAMKALQACLSLSETRRGIKRTRAALGEGGDGGREMVTQAGRQ